MCFAELAPAKHKHRRALYRSKKSPSPIPAALTYPHNMGGGKADGARFFQELTEAVNGAARDSALTGFREVARLTGACSMPSPFKQTCDDTLFCRVLILAAGDARDGVTALGRRLLARHDRTRHRT